VTELSLPTIPRCVPYALQKTMRAIDIGAELGGKIFVLWGGREGVETDACRRADEAIKRLRCAVKRRWSTAGGKTRPGTGSLRPVAIGAAVEATKPLKPPVERVA